MAFPKHILHKIISVFRFFANHPPFLFAVIVIHVLSIRESLKEAHICVLRANETIPDSRFGYSAQELNHLYHAWGSDGRQAYIRTANTDLFPFMQSYALVMGSLLVIAAQRMKWKDEIAWLAVLTMLLDACETLVQRRGSKLYPEHLSALTIAGGSICCQLKWLFSGASILLLAFAFLFGTRRPESFKKRSRRAAAKTKVEESLKPAELAYKMQ